ncbi:hypothetical protein FNV43_RR14632 [Rhamnella rubrinervis]|uniref:SHSP domain-containing protein n=1 Tax=Rhamnella rubrinervis TaxID=2594499 RepID=A0A8K0H3G0_9ROSA|nr:hypothetical protein FNV43_RR14632 [Rhamnella rubrinervis]
MEVQAVRRRVNTISAHLVPIDELSATHVLPMNCSSSLNSVIGRRDNKMYFARQGSASQSSFMRQASNKKAQSGMPPKSPGSTNESCYNSCEGPLFSRPSRTQPHLPTVGAMRPVPQGFYLCGPEPPKFSRPSGRVSQQKELYSKTKSYSSESNVIEWSPRTDIAECGCNYVMRVEVPGVSINNIRVEVDDQKLTIRGKRSGHFWKVRGCSNDLISAYHKREILQGPYEVVWPLPPNVNRDAVSAEFLDGFLQIIIPKL